MRGAIWPCTEWGRACVGGGTPALESDQSAPGLPGQFWGGGVGGDWSCLPHRPVEPNAILPFWGWTPGTRESIPGNVREPNPELMVCNEPRGLCSGGEEAAAHMCGKHLGRRGPPEAPKGLGSGRAGSPWPCRASSRKDMENSWTSVWQEVKAGWGHPLLWDSVSSKTPRGSQRPLLYLTAGPIRSDHHELLLSAQPCQA